MKRRGSYGNQRLQRFAFGVGVLLFVLVNLYIYSETHRVTERLRRRKHPSSSPLDGSGGSGNQEAAEVIKSLGVEVEARSHSMGDRNKLGVGLEGMAAGSSRKMSRAHDSGGSAASGSGSKVIFTDHDVAFVHNRTAWPYNDLDDMVRALVDREFWGPEVPVQADGHYDFNKVVSDNPAVIEAYHVQNKVRELTGCNSVNVPFLADDDTRCIDYLTDMKNWKELRPLPMEFDQRTIKFEAMFHALRLQDGQRRSGINLVKSILKVPQRLFPNEAFSEAASFHADRVMGINRIPPTGWVCIPEEMIRLSVETYAATTETVDEFLQESGAANYSDWVEKDLFAFGKEHKLFARTSDDRRCVYASIQLKVADVFHLLDSALKIPYVPHNDSWHRYFNIEEQHDAEWRPIFYGQYFAASILHISELSTFDYVIGNGDRSPNKNNFVVGACTRKSECASRGHGKYVYHPNHPTYVHLDQGMGFYGTPKRNPIKDSLNPAKPPSFCFFRAPLLSRLDHLLGETEGGKSRFEAALWEALPKGIRHYVTERKLKSSADNIRAVLALARRCLQRPYAPYVLGP